MGAAVELGVLGPFELRVEGGEPLALGGGRESMILAILALNANEVIATDRIIDELWEGDAPSDPAHAVQVYVSRLRRVLGRARTRLTTERSGYCLELEEASELDAGRCMRLYSEARALMARGRHAPAADLLRQALALWHGAPLADFTFERFAKADIARLEELRVSCREELIEAELGLGQHASVVHDLEGLIARYPHRERLRGQLMLSLYRCGRQAEALDAYQQARHSLMEELAIEPSTDLRRLEQAILQQDPSLAPPAGNRVAGWEGAVGSGAPHSDVITVGAPRASEGAFVGRGDCLQQMRSRWKDSKEGGTNLVWLAGKAGIGKTRLATQFAEEVYRDGGVVSYGRADIENLLPYQPIAEVLDHLMARAGSGFIADVEDELATLSRPFPNLRRYTSAAPPVADQETMRYQVFEAAVSVLVRASAEAALLVVLDDLQWADQPTLLLLRHLLRRAQGACLLAVGTFRPDERNQPLDDLISDLRRERRYDRLNLDGLDEEATRELVADRVGLETTPAFIRRLQRQTDGNAFFIEETLRALVESDLAKNAVVDEDALDALGVPDGVAAVIIRRTAQLSPLALQLLTVASVVGPSFSVSFVEEVMRAEGREIDRELEATPADVIAAAADEGLMAGLTVEVQDQFEVLTFSHALVREVLYERLTVSRRVRLHNRVAQALERSSERGTANPAELAHHFLAAKPMAGPEPARRYSIAAGKRAAEAFAYEEAAEHLRRALTLYEDGDDEAGRCDTLLTLGRVQWHMGDDGARSTFLAAAESAERRGASDQLARAAIGLGERYFEVTYLGARYRDLLEKALAAIGSADSPRRVVLLSRLAVNQAFPNEDAAGQKRAEEAVAMARRVGDERTLVAALMARHITLLDVRHIEERLALSDELSSLVSGHEELAAERHHWRMYDLLGVGELAAARRQHDALERLADKLGQPLLRSLALGSRGLWAELAGDDEGAEQCAKESFRQAKLAHTHDAVSSWGSQVYALRRRQGRVGELVETVEGLAASGGRALGWLSALGVLRLETGDEQAARAIYDEEMGTGPARLARGMFWLTRISLLSELAAGLGDVAGAKRLYEVLSPHAGRNVVVAYCSFWGPVDRYLALLAETFGDETPARRHRQAARAHERRFDAAVTAVRPVPR